MMDAWKKQTSQTFRKKTIFGNYFLSHAIPMDMEII
jgi:hypothetical protein